MKCPLCRQGSLGPGSTHDSVSVGEMILVLKGVPADICYTRGESYYAEEATRRLLDLANEAAAGVVVDVRRYVAA